MIKMLVTFDVENKHGIAASAAKQCEPFARRLAELPLARLAAEGPRIGGSGKPDRWSSTQET